MLYLPTVNTGALVLHSVTSCRPDGLLVPLLAGGCQSTVISYHSQLLSKGI